MNEPVNVFIPAAGLGERLQPITFHIPKPLLPIAGKPILEMVLERVVALSVKRIGINLYYKKDVIQEWINQSGFKKNILTFPEEPLLGTGGALKNAEKLLSEGIFLVHNSDILSDIDLGRLIEHHRLSGNMVTLAVHDFPKFNTIEINPDGLLLGVGNVTVREASRKKTVAFTGIAVYSPEFLDHLPEGVSSVVDAWLDAAATGQRIGTLDVRGCFWSDIGTPSAYAAAVVRGMRAEAEMISIHPSARGCHLAELEGHVVMEEKSSVRRGVTVRNCILLPGSDLKEKGFYQNCIIGPDFKISFNEGEVIGSTGYGHIFPIGTGGSDREYFRVKGKKSVFVLVRYSSADDDFQRHLSYTRFFRDCGIPVPALFRVNAERIEAEFEDLGDISLYHWLKCIRPQKEVEDLYRKVIDIAVMMHTKATIRVSECHLLGERIFDYDHLRWETGYFMENFVHKMRKISVEDSMLLEDEFHRLARNVDSFLKTVIHRDLQSQNIMITRGAVPRLIDYQGARIGPPAYDLVSLLWDPYVRLEERLRERLLQYYIEKMKKEGSAGFEGEAFRATILPCRLQRHMQALGAYGFLSSVKGKKHFLKYAEEGIRLLREDVILVKDEYPGLYGLAGKL